MKKVFFTCSFVGLCSLCSAQTTPPPVVVNPGNGGVIVNASPDLIFTNVSIGPEARDHKDNKVFTESSRTISFTIKNTGNSALKISLTRIYVLGSVGIHKSTPTFEQKKVIHFKIKNGSNLFLLPGESFSNTYKCSITSKWEDMKYLWLTLDAQNLVKESNEDNNQVRIPLE